MKGILIEKQDNGSRASITDIDEANLPAGDVTVRVEWSTLNYKDALAITGRSPVVRSFPLVPGIDLAGVVEASEHAQWKDGDHVILNGYGVGEKHWGGLAQRARVSGDLLVRTPAPLTSRDAMAVGTAGYTAMLCVLALERHGVTPAQGMKTLCTLRAPSNESDTRLDSLFSRLTLLITMKLSNDMVIDRPWCK